MKESVTVSIPTYNSHRFIRDAIKSINDQSYRVSEIIITDDNSSDNTIEIVKEYAKADNRIKIYKNKKNLGYPKNWNKCFEYCKTKYLVILHHDDMLQSHCIEKQINFLVEHPDCALVGGQEDIIDEKGKLIKKADQVDDLIFNKGQVYEFVKKRNIYIPCSSVMFDMVKIKEVGYFDTETIGVDELYWPKVLQSFNIAILGESLIYRRYHPDQTEYIDFIKYYSDALTIYKNFNRIISYENQLVNKLKIKRCLAKRFSLQWINTIAFHLSKNEHKKMAIGYIIYAVRINPLLFYDIRLIWRGFIKTIYYLAIK